MSLMVLQAFATGEHVVLYWHDRVYNGHIVDADETGFSLWHPEDGGLWSSWDAPVYVDRPGWDTLLPPNPCETCLANRSRSS